MYIMPWLHNTGYGVSTDVETYYTARIMMVSLIPFLILQLAKILNSTSGARIIVLVSLIVTLVILIVYCTYQVTQTSITMNDHCSPADRHEICIKLSLWFICHASPFAYVDFLLENEQQWCRYCSHGFRIEDINIW